MQVAQLGRDAETIGIDLTASTQVLLLFSQVSVLSLATIGT
jgi:hypothetical protein